MEAAQARRERAEAFPHYSGWHCLIKEHPIKVLNLKTIFYSENQNKAAEPHQHTPCSALPLHNLYDMVCKSISHCQLEGANSRYAAGMQLLPLTKLKTTTLCTVEQHASSNHSTLPVILISCKYKLLYYYIQIQIRMKIITYLVTLKNVCIVV